MSACFNACEHHYISFNVISSTNQMVAKAEMA